MDYLESMREGEEELRRVERNSKKWGPPDGMNLQIKKINRCYLLSMLRMQARQVYYGLWARKENINLEDVDFEAMELILASQLEDILLQPVLRIYLQTIAALKLDPANPNSPLEIERLMVNLTENRRRMDREDFAYLATYLSGYAVSAYNKKQGDYEAIALYSQIPVLEGKYGTDWDGEHFLAYRLLSNLASSAMNLARKHPWRGLKMDLVEEIGPNGTVYDWIEGLLAGYESRLDKKYLVPTLAYVRARAAFYQNDYPEVANQALLFGKHPYEVFGQNIRQLSLMAYYELMYCQGPKHRPLARKLEPNPKTTLRSMRENLGDMDERQNRGTYQLKQYALFVDSFSELLSLKLQSEKLPEGSNDRFRFLFKPRRDLLEKLADYDHLWIKWVRRQLKSLQ